MSKKRPTESSWDSDEELLNDTSGITAFPKNSSELDLLAADGELEDEDALLSIDEANAKHASSGQDASFDASANATQQDVGVDEQAFVFEEVDTGDLEDELNVPGEEEATYQDQQFVEDAHYDENFGDSGDVTGTDVYQGEEAGDSITYTEEGVTYEEGDPSMQEYNQEAEVDPNYAVAAGEDETTVELAYEQPEEQEGQVHLEYGDGEAPTEEAVEGSESEHRFESESDSDDEGTRHNRGKFTTERTGTISLVGSKERSSIPDTLELDKEQAEQINKFMADKNQGGKKSGRGRSGVHSRLGPRPGGPPRLRHMPPGPNAGPNFPVPVPGPLSPRMLMGLIRGGAQVLRGLLPAQLLNARGPMAAQNIVRALGQRGPFPDRMPGPRGPFPMGAGDPRGPLPPQALMNQMRGPMRPGPHLGPHEMGERGPFPPRMPGGPFPGPMRGRPPHPGMPQGPMRLMGPRGPGGPPHPDGPRRMFEPPMGRGPRLRGDSMMGPQQIRGLMNSPPGPIPNQPPIRPLIPNALQLRAVIRNQGPPTSQGGSRGLSVHDRLGPRGFKGKPVPPLMGIDASKPVGQKLPSKSEQGQPIPSLVKPVTATGPPGQANRPVRPQGPRFGAPDQTKQLQQKGPRGLMSSNPTMGQPRHKIYINPRFQGPQNPGARQPTGITRTVRFGTPLQQRKAKALLDKAVQNKMNPNVGARGPINLKRRSTGSDDVPTKVIRTVGQFQSRQTGPYQMNVDRDGGKFRTMLDEQKRKRDLIIKRKELARQKQAAEKRKVLVGLDGQSGPGPNRGKPVMASQNAPIQHLGSSIASRLGPPTNRQGQPPPTGPARNIVTGSAPRGPPQQMQPRFGRPLQLQRGPPPVVPRMPSATNRPFKPLTIPPTRPPGTPPVSMNQFRIPPPSSAPRYQTPPPRMNTAPSVPPPVNIHSAPPPGYQAQQPQTPTYQAPPPTSAPAYPPPPVPAATQYPPPASAPPASHYPPHTYAPPVQHPPLAHPPSSSVYQPPHTTYQPTQAVQPQQPPPTRYQPSSASAAAAAAAPTPSYPPPAVQPTQTEYPPSYPPPSSHYPTTPQPQEQQQYYDFSTGTYYPATTQVTASSQTYQYAGGQTQTQPSSYYDYSANASHQNSAYSLGTQQTLDQRTVQHQSSVGQPIQTIGRRVQPATGSQMRSIVHNVTSSSSSSSHSSQSGRVVVDTNVSVLPGPQKVAVYNVAKQATRETLLKVCRHFGRVMNIQFIREQDRAIIQFETGEQAAKCVSKCDQKCLLKTRLTVKLLPN